MGDKNTLCKGVDMLVRLMVDRLMEQMLKSNIKQEDDGDEVERGEPEYLVVWRECEDSMGCKCKSCQDSHI